MIYLIFYYILYVYMRIRVEEFIEKNIKLINENKWDIIYATIFRDLQKHQIGRFSRMMLECDINPLKYLNYVPSYFFWAIDPAYCKGAPRNLKHIYIPDNITLLESKCFANANYIEILSLPENLSINPFDRNIFENTTSIRKIEIRISSPNYIEDPRNCLTYIALESQFPENCEILFTLSV